jgi:hypothetical protein
MPRRLSFALGNGPTETGFISDFDEAAFRDHAELVLMAGFNPDFIVVPDIVAAGLESLRFSLKWLPKLQSTVGDVPLYLAVQDGMSEDDVRPLSFDGLFVGGTDPWKTTTSSWVKLAHENNLLCHLGRAGAYNKIKLAKAARVDSIDSSLPLMGKSSSLIF